MKVEGRGAIKTQRKDSLDGPELGGSELRAFSITIDAIMCMPISLVF